MMIVEEIKRGMHAKSYYDLPVISLSLPEKQIDHVRSPSSSGESSILHHHHPRHWSTFSSIFHSRHSYITHFAGSSKDGSWKMTNQQSHYNRRDEEVDDDSNEHEDVAGITTMRCYVTWFILGFIVLFTFFSLILWGASKPYKPNISIQNVVFESYHVQAGMDFTGVPTKILSINSTVKMAFRNRATFFGIHVSSSPLELCYYELQIASGYMEEFYQARKSEHIVTAEVAGSEVPLYGGGSGLSSSTPEVPLNLTFTVRSRAHVLGRLVQPLFYRHIRCSLLLSQSHLGKPVLPNSCLHHD